MLLFIASGGYGLYENLLKDFLTPLSVSAAFIVLAASIYAAARLGAAKQHCTLDDIAASKIEEKGES